MTRRAVVYARQSLDRDGEGLAVARQVDACRELVARKGWTLVTEPYVDNDQSATTGRRPRYEAMLERVRAGGADVIMSWAPDRLARRPRDLEDILDLAEQQGVTLATIAGDVDLSTPYGAAVTRIMGAIARQESQQKGARQKAANAQRAKAGTVPWTRRPFGFDLDAKGAVVLVESEAAELRRAADYVLAGGSLGACVRDLNARGVTTSAGNAWTVTTLRRLLTNPRAAGHAAYLGAVVGTGGPAVLTPDEHARLVAHLDDPARRTQTGTTRKYLLSGTVLCGRCGAPMFASPMGPKGGYWLVYRCRTAHLARRLDLVDAVVEAAVLARLSQPDAADLLVSQGEDADALRAESVELRSKLDQLAALLVEGVLTADGVREQSARLRGRLDEVERRRVAVDRPDALAAMVTAEDVRAAWEAAPLDARRQVVDALMAVTVLPAGRGARFAPEQVNITWR